ncbi:MAG: YccF domain-containing protein [Candidatus Limnocylindrales bacterium]
MVSTASVLEVKTGPHILVRIAWYFLVGWWVTGIAMALAWLAAAVVLGLPLSFWLVNRIPTMLTLRPRREQYLMVAGADGVTRMRKLATQQTNLLLRIVYFVLIGWWLSALWMAVAYVLMLTVLGIPIGMMMVNRIPFVFSLHRGYA